MSSEAGDAVDIKGDEAASVVSRRMLRARLFVVASPACENEPASSMSRHFVSMSDAELFQLDHGENNGLGWNNQNFACLIRLN